MDDLEQLRTLLLKQEQESLSKLKIQLEKLDEESRTPAVLMGKISPLISSIIKKSYVEDKKVLMDVLSPIVLELIDKNYTESQDKVVKQIAPLIATAIKEQIKSHKDEIVDALYPVIGNMITRYVSKTFEDMLMSINNQIKNGLSLKTFSRKIKAKIHGISESELLLKENASTNIRTVFFIHKDTGTILSHTQNINNPINEPEMIASMMTAIRSFVNDWVDKNEKHHEINTIEYGGSKIVLEASGYSYLAVIVDGTVSNTTINKIREVLSKLVSLYGNEIKNFDGNMQSVPCDEFHTLISELIDNKKEEVTKKLHPIIYILPLIFVSWIIYLIYNNTIDNNIEKKANEILYKTPELTIYRLDVDVNNKEMIIKGVVPFEFYKELAYKNLENIKGIKNIKNSIQVIDTLDNPKEINDKIIYLNIFLNSKEGNKLNFEYTYPNLIIYGSVYNNKERQYIEEQFKSIEGLKNIKYKIDIIPPKIEDVIYFDENSSEILLNQEYKLINIINILHKLDDNLTLEIQAYRDFKGTIERNEILVKQRAENIMKYLKLKGNVSQKLVYVGVNEIPTNIDLENYPEQGRRAIFLWKK
jgi:outer membrane protein OmpA-like peptidoglycan-associated protein